MATYDLAKFRVIYGVTTAGARYDLAKYRFTYGITGSGSRYDLAKYRLTYDNTSGILYQLAKYRVTFTAQPPLLITLGQEQHLDPFATCALQVFPQIPGQNVYDAETYVFQQISALGGTVVPTSYPLVINPETPWTATFRCPALFTPTTLFFRVTVLRLGIVAVTELKCVVAAHAGFMTRGNRGIEIRTAALADTVQATWLSGAGMPAIAGVNHVANGDFNVWRGGSGPMPIAATWQDSTYATASAGMNHLITGGTYANWVGSMDVTVGGLWTAANGGNGGVTDTWAMAAAGTLDARWTTIINNLKTKWNSNPSRIGTPYVRFAHEMNANWFDWQVRVSEVANFKLGWIRFANLLRSLWPAAKLVFSTIAEKNGNEYNWNTLWPGDSYVDVLSTDYYADAYKHVFVDGGAPTDSLGGPRTLETHRAFAEAHGVPFGVSEWGLSPLTVFGTGDDPNFIQYVYDFCHLNAGGGIGRLLYELYFNESKNPTDRRQIYYFAGSPDANGLTTTEFPIAAARYQALF